VRSGGLARRATVMKMMRKKEMPLLLVDTGGVLPARGRDMRLRADVSFKGMKLIGYDAVNLGTSDFYFGSDYLKDMASMLSIPFVSTNLVSETENNLWYKQYIIKELEGIKVGILGLISPKSFEALPNRDKITGLRAVPPESVLKKTITQLRNKVDSVLLLSQLSLEETATLIHEISGIDIAIVSSTSCEDFPFAGTGRRPLMLCVKPKGETLGSLEIKIPHDRRFNVLNQAQIELNDSVSLDPEINDLITNSYRERKREANMKKQEVLHQKLLDDLKSSPEEFFKSQKNNPSRRSRSMTIPIPCQ